MQQLVDPRYLFCLTGIAVRIATRLGLHRDGGQFGLPPFESEQRRRLWWQIVVLDKRVTEMTGSTVMALSLSGMDSRLPLNVNDTDLHPHVDTAASPATGATEMLFCLTRIELTTATSPSGMGPNDPVITKLYRANKSGSSTQATDEIMSNNNNTHLSHLNNYCAYMESMYLRLCNPRIHVQHFTLLMAHMSLCKLRVAHFLSGGISNTTHLNHSERDTLFEVAIQMLDYDNTIYSTESLRCFQWYTRFHFPVLGYIFLMSELRHYTTGALCERAWNAVCDNHRHRHVSRNLRSPVHIAFGHLCIKAWDAHEAAELDHGRVVHPPELVLLLRRCSLPVGQTSHTLNSISPTTTTQPKNPFDSIHYPGFSTSPASIYPHHVAKPSGTGSAPGDSGGSIGPGLDTVDTSSLSHFGDMAFTSDYGQIDLSSLMASDAVGDVFLAS